MWCMGICLFMMIVGVCPFNQATDRDPLFVHIMNGGIRYLLNKWNKSSFVNSEIIELFTGFFKYENQRITMEQLKKCRWLN